jgi:chromosome segregation ATPase
MKKSQIMILVIAGCVSFTAMFGTSWFVKKQKAQELAQLAQQQPDPASAVRRVPAASTPEDVLFGGDTEVAQMGMSERQLQNLIHDIREKLKDFHKRQKQLEEEAERIEISRQTLQTDIDRLNSLRNKLDVAMSEIKQKEQELAKSIVQIDELEKTNFQRLASTYEKMDVAQAGKIMVTMAASSQLQDSVKIIYYMTDRSAAKLLGEIAMAKPELATIISSQLKRIKESE